MSARRGACPTLARPMETGDGLLVRLNPAEGRIRARQLAGLARAAARLGNGVVEITARGSLQIRGLTEENATALGDEVTALGIALQNGVRVDINPLAGLDAAQTADPRGLTREIRMRCEALGLSERLGPKVCVTVDGGGALKLGGMAADVKLEAIGRENKACPSAPFHAPLRPAGQRESAEAGPRRDAAKHDWLLRVGGTAATARVLGYFAETEAAEIAVRVLAAVAQHGAEARARDLSDSALAAVAGREPSPCGAPSPPARPPVGRFALSDGGWARGFALGYGQIGGGALAAFVEVLDSEREIRLARGRGLIVPGVAEDEDAALLVAARRLGLVATRTDPRLFIAACAGKPACASAHLATKRLAERLVTRRPRLLDGAFTLHLSGCEKRCAQPSSPAVALVGTSGGCEIHGEGCAVPPDLETALFELADEDRQIP